MMGEDFYKTIAGRRFFDGTLPKLVQSVNRLASAIERANELKTLEILGNSGDLPKTSVDSDLIITTMNGSEFDD